MSDGEAEEVGNALGPRRPGGCYCHADTWPRLFPKVAPRCNALGWLSGDPGGGLSPASRCSGTRGENRVSVYARAQRKGCG